MSDRTWLFVAAVLVLALTLNFAFDWRRARAHYCEELRLSALTLELASVHDREYTDAARDARREWERRCAADAGAGR